MDADLVIDLTTEDDEEFQDCSDEKYSNKRFEEASTSATTRNVAPYNVSSSESENSATGDCDPPDMQDQWLCDHYFEDFDLEPEQQPSDDDAPSPGPSATKNDSEDDFDMPASQTSLQSFHPISDSDHSDGGSVPPPPTKKIKVSSKKTTTLTSSTTIIEKEKITNGKTRRKRTAEERQAEADEKQRKKIEREQAKRLTPGECLKHLIMEVDNSLVEIPALQALLLGPPINNIKHRLCDQTPFAVRWVREVLTGPQGQCREERCNQIVQVLNMDCVKELVLGSGLVDHITTLKTNLTDSCRLAILILGSQQYFRANSGKKCNPMEINKSQLDEAIACCQIELNVTIRLVETAQDVNDWLYRYSKAVGEQPHKMKKRRWEEKLRFHLGCEKGKNIRVGFSATDGLPHLWLNVLRKFRRATLEACQAITEVYPSPSALIEAYEACSSESEARKLLQNIQMKRGNGPLAVQRRVGPVLSHKVHTLFTSTDPTQLLKN